MADAPIDGARLQQARARILAFTERLVLENTAADYRRGRDPSDNLRQLIDLQTLKRRLEIQPSNQT
ncbi:MAG: hypothetical protein EPO08_14755 [Rhodospirillaceae bacterium]|nr:MAG: hypothetical protein EPO08_14755 [Rhodospirillaceae bacterium]